ncbi:MAG: BMP family ABC transporter substrate-binding protein [Oscillospiraceae bacterium]|nr:BMP family ABC transporter substrate-binding protein [Oscillospiraceae bacterium]
MKKLIALLLAALMVFGMVACGNSGDAGDEAKGLSESPLAAKEITKDFEVAEDFKIGFICLHDEKSTYDKNFLDAADEAIEALGLTEDQYIIKINIPEGKECYEAAADLVDQGCDVVFANSFGHEDFMLQAAKEFPEVQFCHATGYKAHLEGVANYHNAFASIYEGRYLAGIAAGMKLNEMIEAGEITAEQAKMGYVGAFTYAEVISGYSSFYLGAKSVCPSVTMDVQFTGSWYDAVEEQNAAEALIARDCVLISQHADSMGAPGACEAAGVPNVSYNGATYDACPETFIVSSRINWAPYFAYIIKCANTGATIDTDWCGGINEGSVVLTGINEDVAAEGTLAALKEAVAGLKDGSVNVFDTANFTVGGAAVTGDNVVDGIFQESKTQSAPYFDLKIDGITCLNEKF